MKILNVLFLLFFTGTVLSQNLKDEKGRKQGAWQKNYPNSQTLEYKGQFKDDQPVGKFIYNYPDGRLKMVIVHDQVTKRSEAFMYYDSGKLMSYGIYRNQKKDSIWTQYGVNNNISSKETYKNGVQEGRTVVYFASEDNSNLLKIGKEMYYSKGQLHGTYTEYFITGTVRKKANYVNGKLQGACISYQPDGKMLMEENYKEGKKHGFFRTFDDTGKEIGRKFYQYGNEYTQEQTDKYIQQCKAKGKNPNE